MVPHCDNYREYVQEGGFSKAIGQNVNLIYRKKVLCRWLGE